MDGLVRIRKMTKGGLTLLFQSIDDMSTTRAFSFKHNEDFKTIPLSYAVSLFVIPGTLSAYQKGLFTFSNEDKEKILQKAKEVGFYYDTEDGNSMIEQPKLYDEKQMKDLLIRGRTKEIKEVLDSDSYSQISLLISVAKENLGDIRSSVIKMIEQAIGLQLSED